MSLCSRIGEECCGVLLDKDEFIGEVNLAIQLAYSDGFRDGGGVYSEDLWLTSDTYAILNNKGDK